MMAQDQSNFYQMTPQEEAALEAKYAQEQKTLQQASTAIDQGVQVSAGAPSDIRQGYADVAGAYDAGEADILRQSAQAMAMQQGQMGGLGTSGATLGALSQIAQDRGLAQGQLRAEGQMTQLQGVKDVLSAQEAAAETSIAGSMAKIDLQNTARQQVEERKAYYMEQIVGLSQMHNLNTHDGRVAASTAISLMAAGENDPVLRAMLAKMAKEARHGNV